MPKLVKIAGQVIALDQIAWAGWYQKAKTSYIIHFIGPTFLLFEGPDARQAEQDLLKAIETHAT